MPTYFVCGFSLEVIEKIASLLFGLATISILLAGYFEFLQNKLRDKQLDTVTSLVRQIQQVDWHYLHFNKFDNLPSEYRISTLFDIIEMKEFDECDSLMFWGIDNEANNEELHSWNFFYKFYSHPFLPISIAIPLKKFNFWREQKNISLKEMNDKKYIALGRKKVIPENAYFFYFVDGGMKSCKEFKLAAKELKDAIIKWAKKYRLDDLNITTSHIHRADK